MKLKLTPGIKGLITVFIMIGLALWIDNRKESINPKFQFLIYIIYAAGIFWTIFGHIQTTQTTISFSILFNKGFRCFIVVSLLMVVFTIIFLKMHPEFAVQEAATTKDYYVKQGGKTPAEIEELAASAKNRYGIIVISLSIFRYLLIGAGITALFSALLSRRK